MTSNPCFGCTERNAGCHSVCDKYKDWKILHDAETDAQFKARHETKLYSQYQRERRAGALKRYRDGHNRKEIKNR